MQHLDPQGSAAERELVHVTRGLTNGPDSAEVPDRRTGCLRTPLEECHRPATFRGEIGMRESEDPSAHDRELNATSRRGHGRVREAVDTGGAQAGTES